MKKKVGRILCFFAAFAMLFATACGGDTCPHEYTWSPLSPATCLETGLEQGVCKICTGKVTRKTPLGECNFVDGFCSVCGAPEPAQPETPPTNPPASNKEQNDLATSGCVSSLAPENYGTTSQISLQSAVVSENSTQALMGTFNNIGAPVYQGGDIWTWAEFDLTEYYGKSVDLRQKSFTYDCLTQNCWDRSSIIVVSANGMRSAEISYGNINNGNIKFGITHTALSNGWLRININLSYLYADQYLQNAAALLIMFSNADSVQTEDSVFYIDNAVIKDGNAFVSDGATVYNPDGYYSGSESLKVRIAGNSFIATSNTAFWLNTICQQNNAPLSAEYTSVGNGRIPNQINEAFCMSGYMRSQKYDLIILQDFYGADDVVYLSEFLQKLADYENVELKIYPGENETNDGKRAADLYGLDYVPWKETIQQLKTDYGFTAEQLNSSDGWHPNDLSGVVGAILLYMEIYGEAPVITSSLASWFYPLLPGNNKTEQMQSLDLIMTLAKSKMGIS